MQPQSFGLSMGFEVQITDEAFGDLDAIAGFIKRQASIDIAREWFAGIIGTIDDSWRDASAVRSGTRG